ncbi:methyl-accepting chemotaxis protein [Pseudomonas syringae]|jgi:methyl-accepting chemotaxis protein|uniref:Histidine kinase, HAMP region: chemotaxis sensory transducer n=4 Tax=Pseudomonas TaxID=286 RepID=A0A3M4YGZ9_9PSED|nr:MULTISPECIES: methyl-accepting chemotaxis protein [Pseudomonas syringae group]ELP99600.1 histidine kinase, HAMP region: chemotaxis sensory transducer [Pseudomonas syringae BRIP34881]ELQ04231.1 histidine kinase, HAMP region: chemotaxis sensory transducer [Pseudomonas syringae BRIP34876]MBS7418126.1 methyl-accepting chemotaxis protein [Pseudomonas syringae]MBS7439034.1 methyl-accepting chemotaxis protein [Pseudomonas syringae]MBS7460782.1 methyl-accepting chemotaxis protein [Pseudomonas syrin
MSKPRTRIASQLGIALAVILAVVISGSTLFALRSLDASNLVIREEHMSSEARLLADQLNTFHSTLRDSTQRLSGLFEKRFAAGLSLQADKPVTVAGTSTPGLFLRDAALNNDFTEVDEFRSMTAGVATIFVRSGDDFIRISTSLSKQDGTRAIGTVLDRKGAAYERLIAGQSYVGKAVLFDRYYMTQYSPVRDSSGKIIAALFVGFDYTDAQKTQFDNLKNFRIGSTGSLALLDEKGSWLVPPAGVKSLDGAAKSVAELASKPGKAQFWDDGDDNYYSVGQPFAGGPWTVIASMPRKEISEVTWHVGTQLAIGSLLAMIIAVISAIWLLRSKLRPLSELVRQADALGAGDLSVRLNVTSNDEIGQLSGSFNKMSEALSSMVAHIRTAAQEVSTRANALSGLSGGAFEGMEQQSGEITSMAGAVEEFSATSMNIADNMGNTERLAQDNAQQTRIGRTSMEEASSSLQQIATSLSSTAKVIDTLGQRSQEIGSIVGVITSIADQTNLLALNAAIEAARAGEQGRGFAVVADEVRSLASRTREATDEISGMIASIQQETGNAISTMQQGNTLMQEGLSLNAKVASALAQIDEQSRSAGHQFAAITTATQEQSSTATMLSSNLQSIAMANSEQRQVMSNLAITAQELNGLATELRHEVDRFR